MATGESAFIISCQQCGVRLMVREGEQVMCLHGVHFASRRIYPMPTQTVLPFGISEARDA